jgi:ABC-type uncharacterized transport system auxiliary subunit
MRLSAYKSNRSSANSTFRCSIRRVWTASTAAALLAAGLTGCGSAKPVKYFELTHPPTTTLAGSQAPLDVTLLVRLFQTSHLYREDRIVYGSDAEQVGIYENQRWTEPPAELLQDALARGLRSSGQFKTVTTLRSDTSSEFSLLGHLYDFREVSTGSVVARLNYDVELMDLKLGKAVWKHSYSHDEPSPGNDVVGLAAAMDRNVQRSVQEVQDSLVQFLSTYSRK